MTGLDEEFRNREIYAEKILYDTRLNQLLDTLGSVLNDFGGKGKAFNNVYPIRYPGAWDTNEEQRKKEDPEKWVRAETPSFSPSWSASASARRSCAGTPAWTTTTGGNR